MNEFVDVIGPDPGKNEAATAQAALNDVLKSKQSNPLVSKGEKTSSKNFTGEEYGRIQ
ncbi:MAG: hypothetical protein GX876_11870 [Bacteroidales bacterium]|nr:hypothetical protein [Bacteroidales bacterium]